MTPLPSEPNKFYDPPASEEASQSIEKNVSIIAFLDLIFSHRKWGL